MGHSGRLRLARAEAVEVWRAVHVLSAVVQKMGPRIQVWATLSGTDPFGRPLTFQTTLCSDSQWHPFGRPPHFSDCRALLVGCIPGVSVDCTEGTRSLRRKEAELRPTRGCAEQPGQFEPRQPWLGASSDLSIQAHAI